MKNPDKERRDKDQYDYPEVAAAKGRALSTKLAVEAAIREEREAIELAIYKLKDGVVPSTEWAEGYHNAINDAAARVRSRSRPDSTAKETSPND